jgi:outer membrane immunogenic protein
MLARFIGVTTFLLGASAAAYAQDLPTETPSASLPYGQTANIFRQPFDWTGFYAGINAGVGFRGADAVHTAGQAAPNIANIAGNARPGFVDLNRMNVIAGGQAGFNYQSGRYVAGVETDIGYTHFADTRDIGTAQLGTDLALDNRFHSKIDYLGTVRGRLGVTLDRALFYATGGLAYGRTQHSVTMFGPTDNVQFAGDREKTEVGYTVGGGVEYGITRRVSLKAEYLYYDLGRSTLDVAVVPGSGGAGTGYNSHFKDGGNIVRAGINYKF